MPSTSAKQERFMQAAAHNPRFAQRAGIKQSVAREYAAADEGRRAKVKAVAASMGGHRCKACAGGAGSGGVGA